MFYGSIVALVTPFKDGKPDIELFRRHIEWVIAEGSDGIVPCGSTGESATLTHDEHKELIEAAVETADGKVKVIAGTGSNATQEAIELTRAAKQAGADGALLISPYYNKPTQEGLYRHHMAIADGVDIPHLLYNVPGRTALNIEADTCARLAQHPNIVGIKEATGSLAHALRIKERCGDDFLILSGEDAINFPLLAIGGAGSISVTANVIPRLMSRMHRLYKAGERDEALHYHQSMLDLHAALFIETNPIPVKTALSLMGRMTDEFRLPLCEMADANRARLEAALKQYELI